MLGPLLPVLYKVLAIYIGLGLVLAFSERSMVYLPHLGDPPDFGACAALSNAVAKEYEGVRLYHERVSDTRVAVLYHGNAGSVCDRAGAEFCGRRVLVCAR